MNPPKYTAIEYINFLMATQKAYSCTEAERVQPTTESAAAHDAINRLLHRLEPEPEERMAGGKRLSWVGARDFGGGRYDARQVVCQTDRFSKSAMVW
jgi:hypothetical protein